VSLCVYVTGEVATEAESEAGAEAEAESESLSYYEYHRKFFADVMKKIMGKYKDYKENLSSKDYAIVDMYNLLKKAVISYYLKKS
jgi:hypothetical protein